MVIEPRVVQFWSEIILAISNRTRAARSFDFEITRMISDQIALHSVQLPLFINLKIKNITKSNKRFSVFSSTRWWSQLTVSNKINENNKSKTTFHQINP